MALKGNLANINNFKKRLRAAPVTVAASVARRASPGLTTRTRSSFSSNVSVYGDARPKSVAGNKLTLRKTGATERELRFVTVGRIVRCVLGTRYARYLIGKYDILPNGPVPQEWRVFLKSLLREAEI